MAEFKYLAYKRFDEYWYSGQKLLGIDVINSIKPELIATNCEVFETVQTYDANGSVSNSLLYADFDGVGCLDDVKSVCDLIKNDFDIYPDIYVSGGKGFHVIVPITIPHPRPHLISKKFFSIYAKDSSFLDHKVYTSRRLFRCEGSIHHKTGRYKTAIKYDELLMGMDYLNEIASTRNINRVDKKSRDYEKLQKFLLTIYKMVEDDNKKEEASSSNTIIEVNSDLPHCLSVAIQEIPNDGFWNETITLLARWFNSVEYTLEDALEEMFQYDHWKDDYTHVLKVFRSVFRAQSSFGCRNVSLLESNCDKFCRYSQATIDISPFRNTTKRDEHGNANNFKNNTE